MKKWSVPLVLLAMVSFTSHAQSPTVYPEGLKAGDTAPGFTAKDQNGRTISLANSLKKGPVVLLFYRGQWCPYCNRQLSHFSDSLQQLVDKGATVLAITAETAENIQKTIEKTKTSFSVIGDTGLNIMRSYKVNFAVDDKTVSKYRDYGIDFDKVNGSNGANLPVPATYIIGKDGKVKYVFFNTDYRKRALVKDILENL